MRNSVPSPNLFLRPYNNIITDDIVRLYYHRQQFIRERLFICAYIRIHRKHSEFSRPPAARAKTTSLRCIRRRKTRIKPTGLVYGKPASSKSPWETERRPLPRVTGKVYNNVISNIILYTIY